MNYIATIYWEKKWTCFFSYIKGVTFKLISSSHLVQDQCCHFPFGVASHLPYIWKSMDVWLICAIIQSSLTSLTPPPSYFSTLPPPYFTLLPSPPSASVNFLCFNTNLECFPFVTTDWPDHSYHNENFTFNKTIQPDQWVKSWIVCIKEMAFSKHSLKKPISFANWLVWSWFGHPLLTFGNRP